jgi:hypothetical protein
MTRREPVTAKTGRDLGLGDDWADVPVEDWTNEEEQALQQAKMEGRWVDVSIFELGAGRSGDVSHDTLEKGMAEADAFLRDMRDRQARPWLYEPGRSDPTLLRILDKLDELNRRPRNSQRPPTQAALAHEAKIDVRQIQYKLKEHRLKWRELRGYRHPPV